MERACLDSAINFLDEQNIKYELYNHNPVKTMDDCKVIAKKTGVPFCKNLFLQNRQGTEFYLLLIEQDKKFRTAEISKKIEKSRLSFGSTSKLYEYLGVHGGAITPLGVIFDEDKKVQVIVDSDLINLEKIAVHPLVNDATVVVNTKDIFNSLFKTTNHSPIFIEIKW